MCWLDSCQYLKIDPSNQIHRHNAVFLIPVCQSLEKKFDVEGENRTRYYWQSKLVSFFKTIRCIKKQKPHAQVLNMCMLFWTLVLYLYLKWGTNRTRKTGHGAITLSGTNKCSAAIGSHCRRVRLRLFAEASLKTHTGFQTKSISQ